MKSPVSWTTRLEGGVKREVRVRVTARMLKWQFKRSDEPRWDYDTSPSAEDWDMLEDILRRRSGRGRAVDLLPAVQKLRAKAGV